MRELCDIAIIGAGAAGLAAGIFAAEGALAAEKPARRIIILDGAKTIGAKILVSGGGRCNVTHDQVRPDDYFGSRTIVRNILAAFDEKATVAWMAELGVELKREETGKLFPVTDQAKTVLTALLQRLRSLSVEIRTECRVTGVEVAATDTEHAGSFLVSHGGGSLSARSIILCTGGRSLPRTGSDGGGYGVARKLGHHVSETFAALVPLVLEVKMFHANVTGLSHEAELSTFAGGKLIDRRTGSMLWTHFGISGPVVMDASRFWVMAHAKGEAVELRCNFMPGQLFEGVERSLLDTIGQRPRLTVANAVAQHLPERLRVEIMQSIGIDPGQPIGQLSREFRRKLVHALTSMPLPVSRDRGWNYAEVTAGGVPLEEIDFRTMMSRKTPGLFLAGEILDCDGRIGGFNFQWAWATGYLSGRAVAKWVDAE